MPEVESWTEYRVYLVKTLERLDGNVIGLEKKIDLFRQDARNDLIKLQREEIEGVKREIATLQIEFGMQKVRVGLMASGAGALVGGVISYVVKHLA